MGYSLCKILNLGQNFKLPKTFQQRFIIHIGVLLCKNTARKNPKYSRNEKMLKIGRFPKSIAFARYSIWAKILNCLKHVKIDSVFTLE